MQFLGFIVLCVGVFGKAAVDGWEALVREQANWRLMDWLISYEHGFVRRGLVGEVLFRVSDVTSIRVSVLAWLIAMALYAALFGALVRLVAQQRPLGWTLMPLLFAPWFVTFVAHDPVGGFRKDLLMLVLVAVTAVATGRAADRDRRESIVLIALWIMPILVLSHEFSIVGVPLLLALLMHADRAVFRRLLPPLVVIAIAFLATAAVPGTDEHAAAICDRIDAALPTTQSVVDCEGHTSVAALTLDVEGGARWRQSVIDQTGYEVVPASLLVLLGMVPVLVEIGRRSRAALARVVMSGAGAVLLTLPVFYVAVDWGRFVHVDAAGIAIVALATRRDVVPVPEPGPRQAWKVLAIASFTVLYVTAWHLEHFGFLVGGGLLR